MKPVRWDAIGPRMKLTPGEAGHTARICVGATFSQRDLILTVKDRGMHVSGSGAEDP